MSIKTRLTRLENLRASLPDAENLTDKWLKGILREQGVEPHEDNPSKPIESGLITKEWVAQILTRDEQ